MCEVVMPTIIIRGVDAIFYNKLEAKAYLRFFYLYIVDKSNSPIFLWSGQ